MCEINEQAIPSRIENVSGPTNRALSRREHEAKKITRKKGRRGKGRTRTALEAPKDLPVCTNREIAGLFDYIEGIGAASLAAADAGKK